MDSWIRHIERYRLPVLQQIDRLGDLSGCGLEIGAGTCWLACTLSRSDKVQSIVACDLDRERLKLARDVFIPRFRGDEAKLRLLEADFHGLPFSEDSFDFIVADAALHHARDLHDLLRELRRVLKPAGHLVAVREPVLPSLRFLQTWRRVTFGWLERLKGKTERAYSWKEWTRAFEAAGFRVRRHQCFLDSSLKELTVRALGTRWNGVLFSRYFFIAEVDGSGAGGRDRHWSDR